MDKLKIILSLITNPLGFGIICTLFLSLYNVMDTYLVSYLMAKLTPLLNEFSNHILSVIVDIKMSLKEEISTIKLEISKFRQGLANELHEQVFLDRLQSFIMVGLGLLLFIVVLCISFRFGGTLINSADLVQNVSKNILDLHQVSIDTKANINTLVEGHNILNNSMHKVATDVVAIGNNTTTLLGQLPAYKSIHPILPSMEAAPLHSSVMRTFSKVVKDNPNHTKDLLDVVDTILK